MLASLVLVIAACLASVKVLDGGLLMYDIVRPGRVAGLQRVDSPVFNWARRRGTTIRRAADVGFRAPTIVCALCASVFVVADPGPLPVAVGALSVAVSLNIVLVLLAAAVKTRRGDGVAAVSGLHLRRVHEGERDAATALDPILVVPIASGSLVLAYATLYFAVANTFASAFHTPDGNMGCLDCVYFSLITSATVGYGDFFPVAPGTQLLVMSQIVASVTLLSLFVTAVIGMPRTAGGGKS